MQADTIVIGGGASGLMAALSCGKHGENISGKRNILILEHKDKIGKKILATGNGKCNYTNLVQKPDCYHSQDPAFVQRVLSAFDEQQTIEFFKEMGLFPKVKNGYVYPMSEQARSVVVLLETELKRLGVRIQTGVHVSGIRKKKGLFSVETEKGTYKAGQVILAAGGMAYPSLGSDGSGYKLAESLGHHITPLVPALTGFQCAGGFFKKTAGVRTGGRITFFLPDHKCVSSQGELQLTSYGISGIPVFEVSSEAGRAMAHGGKLRAEIDFLPEFSREELTEQLIKLNSVYPGRNTEILLTGLLNQKLAWGILNEAGLLNADGLTEDQAGLLSRWIKRFPVQVLKVNDFAQAQVTAGGIHTSEIDPDTMESRLVKGLYLTGELVDVDGTCGGYNLQWAWSSGFVAGRAAGRNEII
ncbi:NAD(P)/FAD-dependent oxidoreductase [Anaerolentibacter hominis]|uniref:NAD(P)/FAD-dependent oxidoreductase n=1 Tax=Anaerolentibacter hominis TaxID=3079009 RepID=UPI0031B825E2